MPTFGNGQEAQQDNAVVMRSAHIVVDVANR